MTQTMTSTSPITLEQIASEFQKSADECREAQRQMQNRLGHGYDFPGDINLAAHYGKNAAYYQARADAVLAATKETTT